MLSGTNGDTTADEVAEIGVGYGSVSDDENSGLLSHAAGTSSTASTTSSSGSGKKEERTPLLDDDDHAANPFELTRIARDTHDLDRELSWGEMIHKNLPQAAWFILGIGTSAQPFINSVAAWRRLKIEQILKLFKDSTPTEIVMSALLGASSLISNIAVALDNLPQLPGKVSASLQAGFKSAGAALVNLTNLVLGAGAGISLGGLAIKAFTFAGIIAQTAAGILSGTVNFAVRYTGLFDLAKSLSSFFTRSFWKQKSIIDKIDHLSPATENHINQQLTAIDDCYQYENATHPDGDQEKKKEHYLNAYKTIITQLDELNAKTDKSVSRVSNMFDERITRKARDFLLTSSGIVIDMALLASAFTAFQLLYSQSSVDFLRFATRFPNPINGTDTNTTNTTYYMTDESSFQLQPIATGDFQEAENYNNAMLLPANVTTNTTNNYFDQAVPYWGQVTIGSIAGLASAGTAAIRALYLRSIGLDTLYKSNIDISWNGVKNFMYLFLFWAIVTLSVANMFNVATNQVDQAKSDVDRAETDSSFVSNLLLLSILVLFDNWLIVGASIGGFAINAKSLSGVVYRDEYKDTPEVKDIVHYYKDPVAHPLPEKLIEQTSKLRIFSSERDADPEKARLISAVKPAGYKATA
jgi:hypothetical protein